MLKAKNLVGKIGNELSWTTGAVLVAFGMLTLAVAPAGSPSAAGLVAREPTAYVTNSQLSSVSMYVGAEFAGTINVGPARGDRNRSRKLNGVRRPITASTISRPGRSRRST